MSNIQLYVGGKEVQVEIPAIYDALNKALPIVMKLFDGNPQATLGSWEVYDIVGGTYTHKKWLENVIKDCRLVKDVHYTEIILDPSLEENKLAISKGKGVQTYFNFFAARKVVVWAQKEESHLLYEYIDACAQALTPHLLKDIAAKDSRIRALVTNLNESCDEVALLAKNQGFKHAEDALTRTKKDTLLRNLTQDVAGHEARSKLCVNTIHLIKTTLKGATLPKKAEEALERTFMLFDEEWGREIPCTDPY